jgi:glycosyltransferase involved in cell wall biosynthesis
VFEQWSLVAPWLAKDSLFDPEIEWIIVNDSVHCQPPSDVASVIERRRIRLVHPPRNLGVSGARNLGMDHATGAWLDFVDGDDLPLPIHRARLPLDGDLVFFPTAGHYTEEQFRAHLAAEERMRAQFFTPTDYMFIFPESMQLDMKVSSILWRRSSVQSLGGFDSRFDSAEDMEILWQASLRRMKAARVDFCKQSYRYMQNGDRKQLYRHYALFRFFSKILPKLDPAVRPRAERRVRDFLLSFYWTATNELPKHAVPRSLLFKEGLKLIRLALARRR